MKDSLQPLYEDGKKEDQPLNCVEFIREKKQISNIFNSLENSSKDEILLFIKPPYINNKLNEGIEHFDKIKALCEVKELENPDVIEFISDIKSKGGEIRIIDELPIKMGIFDEKISMVNFEESLLGESLTTLVINHPAFSNLLKLSFGNIWDKAKPYIKEK